MSATGPTKAQNSVRNAMMLEVRATSGSRASGGNRGPSASSHRGELLGDPQPDGPAQGYGRYRW